MIAQRLGNKLSETHLDKILTLDALSSLSKERKEHLQSIMTWNNFSLMKFRYLHKWYWLRQSQEPKESDLLQTRSLSNAMLKLEVHHGALKIFLCVMSQQWFVESKFIENWKTEANLFLVGVPQLIDLQVGSIQLQNFKEKMTMMLERALDLQL